MKKVSRILFLLLISVTPLIVFGDSPVRPRSFVTYSANNKFVFVMIAAVPIESDGISYGGKGMQEARRIRAKYKRSGMYLNDESTDPLWTIDWYANSVLVASDGIHLIRRGPWASKASNEAFTFFANGKVIRKYKISELVKSIEDLPHSVSHFEWDEDESWKLDDDKQTFSVSTLNKEHYVFDYRTGKRLSKNVD